MADISLYDFRTLTKAINEIQKPKTKVLDMVFKKKNQNFANTIDIDVIVGNKKIAPFVAPMEGGKVVKKLGQKTKTVKFPRIRLKKKLNPKELLMVKDAGQNLYLGGSQDITKAKRAKIARELQDLKDQTTRRNEWMACQALKGSISYEDEDVAFNIDFNMPDANKPVLTGDNLWGGASADILGNIREYNTLIAQKTGGKADIAFLGTKAVNEFLNDTKIQKLLDNRNVSIGELKIDGADYIGSVNGTKFYEYAEQYVDKNGDVKDYIDKNACVLINTSAEFVDEAGIVEDLKAGSVAQRFFSKMWEEEDPSALWLLTESDTLPVVYQPEAVVYATVTAVE